MFKGLTVDVNPTGATLTVTIEGLEALRDNTTREYSRYFAGLVDLANATAAVKPKPGLKSKAIQPPLPGL